MGEPVRLRAEVTTVHFCEMQLWVQTLTQTHILVMLYLHCLTQVAFTLFWCKYPMPRIAVLACGSTETSTGLTNMSHRTMTKHLKEIT